jgi:hypothetical protein
MKAYTAKKHFKNPLQFLLHSTDTPVLLACLLPQVMSSLPTHLPHPHELNLFTLGVTELSLYKHMIELNYYVIQGVKASTDTVSFIREL